MLLREVLMKRSLFVVVVIVVLSLFVASNATAVEFVIGSKIALGYATFYGDDFNDVLDDSDGSREFYLGAQLGGFLTIKVTDQFAVQPELLFVRGGGAYESGPNEITERFGYLAIPVLFKGIFPAGNGDFVLFAGPNPKIKISDGEVELNGTTASYESDVLRSFVFAAIAGAGYEFPVGNGILGIEARFDVDMQSLADPDTNNDFNQRGLATLIGIGYGVPIGQ